MSLYLEIGIGAGRYLLDAAHVLEVRQDLDGTDGASWQGAAVAAVDLREVFDASATAPGCCILYTQRSGEAATLLVDRVDGLVDLGDGAFRPIPPIGPLGALLDAIAPRLADQRPMLRLRGERALALAAIGAAVRDGADGTDAGREAL